MLRTHSWHATYIYYLVFISHSLVLRLLFIPIYFIVEETFTLCTDIMFYSCLIKTMQALAVQWLSCESAQNGGCDGGLNSLKCNSAEVILLFIGPRRVWSTVRNPEGPHIPFHRATIWEKEDKAGTLINPKWVFACRETLYQERLHLLNDTLTKA